MGEKKGDEDFKIELTPKGKPKISLQELTEDIGAFLHFLRENSDFSENGLSNETNPDICSVWMLIPKTVDVCFREGVDDCVLEKEVFSRTIWIVSEPVADGDRVTRRRELLKYFSNILVEDQAEQVTILLKQLNEESREKILDDFRAFKKDLKNKDDENE